jgi:superfamily I DNA/RNA helicase
VAALNAEQEAALEKSLAELQKEFEGVRKHPRSADAAIFLKAVRYAIDYDEWYDKKAEDGVKKATALLDEAKKRIASLKEGKTPWMDGPGNKVLGFYSKIDDSAQPYGVEIPEGLEIGAKEIPM